MTRDPDPIDFDDIVASWRAEGGVPEWPADDRPDDRRRAERRPAVDEERPEPTAATAAPEVRDHDEPRADPAPVSRPPAPDSAADPASGTAEEPDELADEHFVPPEPPPVPRIGPPMLVGLTLIVLGLVLLTFPGWVGVPQVYGLPLGLVAVAAGLGWLVLRLWPDGTDGEPPPLYLDDPDDPDGGAVL